VVLGSSVTAGHRTSLKSWGPGSESAGRVPGARGTRRAAGALIQSTLAGSREAGNELARRKDPRNVGLLTRSLRDRDGQVRRAAATVLGKIRDPRAIDGLVVMAGGWGLRDRFVATEALLEIDQFSPIFLPPSSGHGLSAGSVSPLYRGYPNPGRVGRAGSAKAGETRLRLSAGTSRSSTPRSAIFPM
jgi:hypothetical protein